MKNKDEQMSVENPIDLDADSSESFMYHRISFAGRCMTVSEWADHLGMTKKGMLSRYRLYGLVAEMFTPKKKFKKNSWEGLAAPGCENPLCFSYGGILRLVRYLIEDAKQEMLIRKPGSLKFREAQNFLTDSGGSLSWWLVGTDINVKAARRALREFATTGWKKQRELPNAKKIKRT